MVDGSLIFDTRIDEDGVDKAINSIKGKLTSAGNVMQGILSANFLQAGINKIIETGQKGIQLASDLEEVQNVVDVTFGEGAAQIEQFAKTASASFGLTELQSKQFTGTIGAMVKSMGLSEAEALEMSTALVGLTGDMASFYNLDHETAFEKIRSGISGETEPLKQLGINMSVANLEAYALTKGIKTAYDQMTEVEKVQLRYNYIMEQTADAQGDFVRTQDSYANQLRLLQNNLDTMAANIGSMLIPMLTSATSWVNSLFAGAQQNETQAAIDGAISSLETVKNDIETIKNEYAKEAIRIRVEYEEAGELIDTLKNLQQTADRGFGSRQLSIGMTGDDVAALQKHLMALGYKTGFDAAGSFGAGTKAAVEQYQRDMGLNKIDGIAGVETFGALALPDVAALVAVTNQLLEIYPQLEEYVGEDGTLSIEAQQVASLTEGYRQLAVEKLAAARVEEIGGVYADALLEMEMLKEQRKQAQDNLDAWNQSRVEMTEAAKSMVAYNALGEIQSQEFVNAMQRFLTAAGTELTGEFIDANNAGSLFGDDGLLKSIDEIQQIEGGLGRLYDLYAQLHTFNNSGIAFEDEMAAAKEAVETADAAIKEHQSTLDQAYEQWQLSQAALANMTAEGKEVGETVVNAAQSRIDEESLHAQAEVNIRYRYSSGTPNGSHATGLNYVPYDNYLARLHVGEAVLTASEAQTWRSQQQGIDYGALASAVRSALGTEQTMRPIVLQIDGKRIASVLAGHNRSAINAYNVSVAKGMGK